MATKASGPLEGFFESSCLTEFKKSKFRFKWTINDFQFYCTALGNKIVSSTFSDGTDVGLKWRLELIPCEQSYEYDDYGSSPPRYTHRKQNNPSYYQYLSLQLYLVSTKVSSFKANCKFSILNAQLKEVNGCISDYEFGHSKYLTISNFIKKENFLDKDAELFLLNDGLTILCEIIAVVETKNIANELTIPGCYEPNNVGLALLQNSEFSDVTLCAGGREIKAHKAMLAIQSRVFTAMFQHDMEESRTNRVDISDMDYDILEEMLYFIYTDKFSNLDHVAELLRAADKYELERLKLRCEEILGMNLSAENAAECYIVADQVKAENLKAFAKSFIIANAIHVAKTSGFSLLVKEYPALVIEALSSISS